MAIQNAHPVLRHALVNVRLPQRPKESVDIHTRRRTPRVYDLEIIKRDASPPPSPELSPTATSYCSSLFSAGSTDRPLTPTSSCFSSEAPRYRYCASPSLKHAKTEPDGPLGMILPPRSESVKRKFDDIDDEVQEDTQEPSRHKRQERLPGLQNLLSALESNRLGRTLSPKVRSTRTPSSSPELGSNYTFSRRPSQLTPATTSRRSSLAAAGDLSRRSSVFNVEDPITASLNSLRKEAPRLENQEPLPPLQFELPQNQLPHFEGLRVPLPEVVRDSIETSPACTDYTLRRSSPAMPDHYEQSHGVQTPLRKAPRKAPRKSEADQKPHNNIKYFIEEQDYIRYIRQDHTGNWDDVLARFLAKFPMVNHDHNRGKSGLQGAYYRENKILPMVRPDTRELIFKENGHVPSQLVGVREQRDRRQHFSLVNLFPERAVNYDWLDPRDRQRAVKLNEARQIQKDHARRSAKERETWVERDPKCACCPKKDRERDVSKRNYTRAQTLARSQVVVDRDEEAYRCPVKLPSKL